MDKQWRHLPDIWTTSCPYCGNDLEVFTDSKTDDLFDSDEVRCVECGCPGQVSVFDEEDAYISMHDEPDCNCQWCKDHPV